MTAAKPGRRPAATSVTVGRYRRRNPDLATHHQPEDRHPAPPTPSLTRLQPIDRLKANPRNNLSWHQHKSKRLPSGQMRDPPPAAPAGAASRTSTRNPTATSRRGTTLGRRDVGPHTWIVMGAPVRDPGSHVVPVRPGLPAISERRGRRPWPSVRGRPRCQAGQPEECRTLPPRRWSPRSG